MSPSSRLVARLLCQCVFALSVFACGSPRVFGDATAEGIVVGINRLRPTAAHVDQLDLRDGSNFELVGCWLEFKHPEIQACLNSIVHTLKLIPQACQHLKSSQEHWLAENLAASIEGLSFKPVQLISSSLLDGFIAGDHDIESAVLVERDRQPSYWSYYRDCERWGVELTRTIELPQPKFAASVSAIENTPREQHEVSLVEDETNHGLFGHAVKQASGWLNRALRQLEFATVESHVSSSREARERRQSPMH